MHNEFDREQAEQKQKAEPPAVPKKRFRVEKLEERIAPSLHSNPDSKLVGGGNGGGGSSQTETIGSYSIY